MCLLLPSIHLNAFDKSKRGEVLSWVKAMPPQSGDPLKKQRAPGIRGLDSTSVFRAVNFELFVKPVSWYLALFSSAVDIIWLFSILFCIVVQNKKVMAAGLVAITGCVGYFCYINLTHRRVDTEQYIALNEDGSEYILPKKSRWDWYQSSDVDFSWFLSSLIIIVFRITISQRYLIVVIYVHRVCLFIKLLNSSPSRVWETEKLIW